MRGVVGLVEVALRTLRARPRSSRPEVLAEVVVPRHGSPADVAHREAATASHLVAPVLLAELQTALRTSAHGRPVDGKRDVRAQGPRLWIRDVAAESVTHVDGVRSA